MSLDEPLCAQDQQAYRQKAARLQFMQSLFQGIGGAMLFGLISSLVLAGGAVAALPFWALLAIPAAGVTCIFIGTRCGIEAQMLSQALSAKMMGSVVKPAVAAAPIAQIEQTHTQTLPPGMGLTQDRDAADKTESGQPSTRVSAIAESARMQGALESASQR